MNIWHQFYQCIRDPSWPDCATELHFDLLPTWIQKEILEVHGGARYLRLDHSDVEFLSQQHEHHQDTTRSDRTFAVSPDLTVHYPALLDGGGTTIGQNFPRMIDYLYPDRQFDHCLDWCAGAGFIGFRLLAQSMCRHLSLMDSFQPAVDCCRSTVANLPAHYRGTVDVFYGDDVLAIPQDHRFDLIVANPPHFGHELDRWQSDSIPTDISRRISIDASWHAHKNFFQNIGRYLSADGKIVLQENIFGSSVQVFRPMLANTGLEIGRVLRDRNLPAYYYLELIKSQHLD